MFASFFFLVVGKVRDSSALTAEPRKKKMIGKEARGEVNEKNLLYSTPGDF